MQPHEVPAELVIEVWRCAAEASTQAMLGRVSTLRGFDRDRYRALIEPAAEASREVAAVRSAKGWIAGLDRQFQALGALGDAAGAAIVPPELEELGALARTQGACFGPAGAGGGDIALWAGLGLPPAHFRARAAALGLCPLPLRLGAAGVHRLPDPTLAAPDRPLAPT
jgi:phosphomevalonate kinase